MIRQNIDPTEVNKFSHLAAHWWDTEGELKTLHEINPLRLNYINQRAPLAEKKVLDVGCGGGILAESMAKLGAQVTGIDMSEAALTVAKLHQHESNAEIKYQCSTVEDLALQAAGQYDIVTCLEMLEHVPDPSSVVAACAKLVKPNGDLFFSTLNRNIKAYLFAIIGAEYVLNLLPKNTHDFGKFIRPSELSTWARKADLSVLDLTGMTYNVFSKKYALSRDVSVNYLMHARKL